MIVVKHHEYSFFVFGIFKYTIFLQQIKKYYLRLLNGYLILLYYILNEGHKLLIILCVALSVLMLLSADMLSVHLRRTGWSRFISTFLFLYSQIIITEFLLGLISALYNYSLFALNLAISAIILTILYKKSSGELFKNYRAKTQRSYTLIRNNICEDPLWSVLLFLGILFVLWIVFLGIVFPALDFDGNSYHLTFIANVIQNHNFFDPPTSLTWLAGYPKGGEFIQMWSALITHNDIFTDLAQIPFMILGVYALYEVSVTLEANKKHARFSALLFLFVPVVLNQLKTTYVDVMLCSLFFASLAMLVKNKLDKLDLLLVGTLFSLTISVKSTGFLFVLVVLPLLFWRIYDNRIKKSASIIKNYINPLLVVITPAAFGLYWYVKNFVQYGSPIYPFGFKMLGRSVFPGQTFQDFAASAVDGLASLPHGCAQRIWFVWTEQKDWFGCMYNYDTNYAGLGPIWFIILIPAIILSIYFGIKKRNYILLTISLTISVLFVIYPSNYYSRYTMFVISLVVISYSIVLTCMNRIVVSIIKVFTLFLVISVIATNFVLCNYPPRLIVSQLKSLRSGFGRGSVYSIIPGRAFVFIEQTVLPNEVVAYSSKPYFIYPLWRPDFSNKVIFVPADAENEWYKGISKARVKYVFTTVYSKENQWAKRKLSSLYKDETYEVFKVY